MSLTVVGAGIQPKREGGGGRGALPYIHRKRCDTACTFLPEKSALFWRCLCD